MPRKTFASELAGIAQEPEDSHAALEEIEVRLKKFKKAHKDGTKTGVGTGETESGE